MRAKIYITDKVLNPPNPSRIWMILDGIYDSMILWVYNWWPDEWSKDVPHCLDEPGWVDKVQRLQILLVPGSMQRAHDNTCCPTPILLLHWQTKINQDQSNLAKAESLRQVHPTPRLYSPGGSTGLTVWLKFAIACFGWEFDPQIFPSPGRQGPHPTQCVIGPHVACWTYDQLLGLTPGQVDIKWLLHGWVTVCRQVNHLGI